MCLSKLFFPQYSSQPWFYLFLHHVLFHLLISYDFKMNSWFKHGIFIPFTCEKKFYFALDLRKMEYINSSQCIFELSLCTSFEKVNWLWHSNYTENKILIGNKLLCSTRCFCNLYKKSWLSYSLSSIHCNQCTIHFFPPEHRQNASYFPFSTTNDR